MVTNVESFSKSDKQDPEFYFQLLCMFFYDWTAFFNIICDKSTTIGMTSMTNDVIFKK